MEPEHARENIALVLRLQQDDAGVSFVVVDGTSSVPPIALVPATFIVRLQRMMPGGVLRGTVRLHGTEHWAPFQSNVQLEELLRAWMSGVRSEGESRPAKDDH